MEKLRWGILGTADIARQNWRAIHDSGNSIITAVASRDINRSEQFIKACQIENPFKVLPKAYSDYGQLIDSSDIDALYIPLPTGLRKDYVIRAAEAGKHVLCEKPCGINFHDVQDMIDVCKRNRVQFMDGVMFMHNPRLQRIRQVFEDGKSIGSIKRIMSIFTFCMTEEQLRTNIRLNGALEPTGCLGDLGWYNIRFSLWTMNWQLPQAVVGKILSQRNNNTSSVPTPTDFSGELYFGEDTSSGFYCSFLTAFQQWCIISGTKGSMNITDFVHPANIHEPSFNVNNAEVNVKCCTCGSHHDESRTYAQDRNMIRNFTDQIHSGQLNDEWPMMAVITQRVVDACFESAKNGSILTLVK